MTELDLLDHGQVIALQPGDSVIFKFDYDLTQDEADEIRKRIADKLDPNIRFLVIGSRIDVRILRPSVMSREEINGLEEMTST